MFTDTCSSDCGDHITVIVQRVIKGIVRHGKYVCWLFYYMNAFTPEGEICSFSLVLYTWI